MVALVQNCRRFFCDQDISVNCHFNAPNLIPALTREALHKAIQGHMWTDRYALDVVLIDRAVKVASDQVKVTCGLTDMRTVHRT